MAQMTNTGIFLKERGDLVSKFAYSIFSGVIGSILLAAFLTLFIDIFRVVKFIPWIIAFNTAMTGYSLLDKTHDTLQHKHLSLICVGILNI
jgi:hypothetical protein